jgi:hypothetical protein
LRCCGTTDAKRERSQCVAQPKREPRAKATLWDPKARSLCCWWHFTPLAKGHLWSIEAEQRPPGPAPNPARSELAEHSHTSESEPCVVVEEELSPAPDAVCRPAELVLHVILGCHKVGRLRASCLLDKQRPSVPGTKGGVLVAHSIPTAAESRPKVGPCLCCAETKPRWALCGQQESEDQTILCVLVLRQGENQGRASHPTNRACLSPTCNPAQTRLDLRRV